jgi:hypothetical protein
MENMPLESVKLDPESESYETPEFVELGNAEVLVQGPYGNKNESVNHWEWS